MTQKTILYQCQFNLNYLFMYDKTTIHSILLGLCIIAYLVSPKTDLTVPIQEVQASQATQTGEIREVPRTQTIDEKLSTLHQKVCQKQINSPLCKDYELFERLYHITEERLPNKQFFPILLGITNAESSIGLDFARDSVWGFCNWRNNWGGTKYQIHDDNTRTYSRELNWFLYGQKYSGRFVDQFGCNLYPFESIEEFWITKVNWMRYGYKWCIDSKTPIRCLSYKYVGSPDVAEESWIHNVSYFIY